MAFRLISAAALTFTALGFAHIGHAADAVELDPGLYDFKHNFYAGGQLQKTDEYEYCITEGRNRKTLNQIVADLVEGVQCTASNVVLTQSSGQANISCYDPDFGVQTNGRVEVEYGTSYYSGTTTATMGGPTVTVVTDVRRRSACPEGWDNPDDVSSD